MKNNLKISPKKAGRKPISEIFLLSDLRKVAKKLGTNKMITEVYQAKGSYSYGTMAYRFGSWNKALQRAGLKINNQTGTKDGELLIDLKRVAKKLGNIDMTKNTYEKYGKYKASVISTRFGSWNKALKRARLQVVNHHLVTDLEILNDLKKVAKQFHNERMTAEKYTEKGKYHFKTVKSHFGNWSNAIKKASVKIHKDPPIYSDTELLNDLRKVASSIEGKIAKRTYNLKGKYNSSSMASRFGSWNNALQMAGVQINMERDIEDERLLDDIKKIADQYKNDILKMVQYSEKGKYSLDTISKRFGSWNGVLQKAGANFKRKATDREILDDIKEAANRIGQEQLTYYEYTKIGRFSFWMISNSFGSWNKAKELAGLL